MLACNFFSVDTVLLKRLYVLFFIEPDTRRVYVTGVTVSPTGAWVVQKARNLNMALAERAQPVKFLIRDRDAKFTSSFDEVFRSERIRIIRMLAQALRANAFDERFVGTVRRECLDRVLILGRRHLEHALADYVIHYNERQPHRAPGQIAPCGMAPVSVLASPDATLLQGTYRLGGLIHEYALAA